MHNFATEWKKNVNFIQISYDDFVTKFSDIPLVYILEKIDGHLGMLIYKNGDMFFQSTGKIKTKDIPVLTEYENAFKSIGIKSCVLAGELVAIKNNTILPFNEISSIVKKSYIEANKPLIHHYLYDIVEINGKKLKFKEAVSFIQRYFGKKGIRIHVPKIVHGTLSHMRDLFSSVKDIPGIEGVVVRDLNGKNYKVKISDTVDIAIIGAGKEGLPAWNKNQVSYLLTSFMDKNGLFRTSSKIGTGFTHKQRSYLYDYITKSSIFEKDGELFVQPKLVVEAKYFRSRITKTKTYKITKNKVQEIDNLKSITFSHFSFERLRKDKKVNELDVRLEQIPEWRY